MKRQRFSINFNPRSPRRERPHGRSGAAALGYFNPRSPRRERLHALKRWSRIDDFNPRSPRRERPPDPTAPHGEVEISIHAPREGSDRRGRTLPTLRPYFNPRSPRRERRVCGVLGGGVLDFNPRSPRRERPRIGKRLATRSNFNPRSPRRERRCTAFAAFDFWAISIHAPREGSDIAASVGLGEPLSISIHAPREGSDA